MPRDHSLMPDLLDAASERMARTMAIDPASATPDDWRVALSLALRDRLTVARLDSDRRAADAKRVHYVSMEFLMGRLLEDGLRAVDALEGVRAGLEARGVDPATVFAAEPDAALGNGGLGRLAACFLDSLAALRMPATGHGILYEHGLFRQGFDHGEQTEAPETWLRRRPVWTVAAPRTRRVGFGGSTEGGWTPHEVVEAVANDLCVPAPGGAWVGTLRLWQPRAVDNFDMGRFNAGDHVGAAEGGMTARAIGRVLYPDDTSEAGKALRLKQEYFLAACAVGDAIEGVASHDIPKRAAIQLNDTHPAIAGPELVRVLHDERGLPFADAVGIARATLAYTNHTLLPEALERWHEGLMGHLLPRHMELIGAIDDLHHQETGARVGIREHGTVGMGPLSVVMAHKVNGVSALHTELVKKTVFADLHRLHPERIVNQTNGVTPRRWLAGCNPRLAAVIDGALGEGWTEDAERLADLPVEDRGFRDALMAAKRANKVDHAAWLERETGVRMDPDAMVDVQIKRIHEYKRQHLNILETIALWQAMRDDPAAGWTPRVKLFGGKAAPGYHFAKRVIRLINDVAARVNADPATRDLLQVAFPPNYNVSMAEHLIPAADLSEQISTAGKEASGTGNMKFAMNGAVTVGTLDGANVEIRERVGAENFFLFGLSAEEVGPRRAEPGHGRAAIEADPRLARALASLRDGTFADGDPHRHAEVAGNLEDHDYFLVCSDFSDYWRAQREADAAYADRERWGRMAAANVAGSGWFSSDRTIRGYAADIWGVAPVE